MKKLRSNKGFSLAEVMLVVALVIILAAVSMIAVARYQRSLTQLEYDGMAKEVFIAAQNHLTMASSQGYLGKSGDDFGTLGTAADDADKEVYYLVVHSGSADSGSVLDLLLPFASVDETVRLGGNYIIRYQKNPARVLDVFYSSASGRFTHDYLDSEYVKLINEYRDSDTVSLKSKRRDGYENDKSVLGWYGGLAAYALQTQDPLEEPTLRIYNEETLYVTVTNPNYEKSYANLKLIVEGVTSGSKREIVLFKNGVNDPDLANYPTIRTNDGGKTYTVVLDDITGANSHFYSLFCNSSGSLQDLIPGENIRVYAEATGTDVLAAPAKAGPATANSLFADDSVIVKNDAAASLAKTENIRHLANLDGAISQVKSSDCDVQIRSAEQKNDMSWTTFKNKTQGDSTKIYDLSGASSAAGTFLPLNPSYALNYDGKSYSISDVQVNTSGNAGLFGTLRGADVHDLTLKDFDVRATGSGNAGALAGELLNGGSTVENVLVIHTSGSGSPVRAASGDAGGLIGAISGNGVANTVTGTAAAVYVQSDSGDAGGLIGSATGNLALSLSYAGGHTNGGAYTDSNVSSATGTAGGLIGTMDANATVDTCYSTCSVSGAVAGGFVGEAGAGTVKNSYSVGQVNGTTVGAFAGTLSGTTMQNNHYLETPNYVTSANKLTAISGNGTDPAITAIDANLITYRAFVPTEITTQGGTAHPYDGVLAAEYKGKYTFPTIDLLKTGDATGVAFLGEHYGDWPIPEKKIVNTKTISASVSHISGNSILNVGDLPNLTGNVLGTGIHAQTDGKVTVTYEEDSLPGNAKVVSAVMGEGTPLYGSFAKQADAVLDAYQGSYHFLDISLRSNGEELQPATSVEVTLQLNGLKSKSIRLVHFGETVEEVPVTVTEKGITFTAHSFSVYGILKHEGDVDVDNARVEFHFLSEKFNPVEGQFATYSAKGFEFVNKAGTVQTSQIIRPGESLEMISNPPNIDVNGKKQYFFGWYEVQKSDVAEDGTVTYTWAEDPAQVRLERPLSITPDSGWVVGQEITWTISGISGKATLDEEGTAHVYLAPIYEDYYFVNFHLGPRDTDIWSTIMNRKMVVLGADGIAKVRIGDITAPSTDATRQVFSGWETVETVEQQKTDAGVPVWLVDGEEIAQADCPAGGTPVMIDVPVNTKTLFQSVDPVTGEEQTKTVNVSDGTDYDPAESDGYYLVIRESDMVKNNLHLYPVYAEAREIRFNTGKSGNGSTYVPSQYLLTSDLAGTDSPYYATRLPSGEQPQRTGYEFLGWYADAVINPETGDIDNLTEAKDYTVTHMVDGEEVEFTQHIRAHQITDSEGNFVDTNYQKTVTDGGETKLLYEIKNGKLYVYYDLTNLTLYARWKEVDETTYTVLVWKQKVTDSAYATDKEKTYDFVADDSDMEVSGRTGRTLQQLLDSGALSRFVSTNVNGKYTGFTLRGNSTANGVTMNMEKVAGDGTTVINVYYDRNVHTLTFQSNDRNTYSYTLTTGTSTPQYAFIDGEVVELARTGDSAPYTWIIPQYGYAYVENDEGGFVKVGDTYVPLEPKYEESVVSTDVYLQTDTLVAGGEYLIVSRGDAGPGYILGRDNTSVENVAVTIQSDTTNYILASDVPNTAKWTVGNGWTFKNGSYYIRNSSNSLAFSTTSSNWNWNGSNLTNNSRSLYYRNSYATFLLRNGNYPVYLYEKGTRNTTSQVLVGYTYKVNGVDVQYTDEQRYAYEYTMLGNSEYTGDRYTRSNGSYSYHTVYVIKALYEQYIGNYFPLAGFRNGERWMPNGDSVWSQVMVYVDVMPNRDVTFRVNTANYTTKTMNYYVQALPGTTEGIVTRNGVDYVLYASVPANYNFITSEDFVDIHGFTKNGSYPTINGNTYLTNYGNTINFYYLRTDWTMTFNVNYPIQAGLTYSGGQDANKIETAYYQQSLVPYGSGGENYFIPKGPDHYNFQGWYEDEAATVRFNFNSTMPAGDKMLYAGWKAERFRVNIDPNGAEIDHINHNYRNDSSDVTVQGYMGYWFDENGVATAYNADKYNSSWTPFSTFNRPGDTGYRTDQSTYFNANYNDSVGRYELAGGRQYVEISDSEAANLGSGNWYYYINAQSKPTDGSSIPSDLRNALYITEDQVDQYYNFYRDWVQGNLDGGYITGTILLGKEQWKDTYLTKSATGGFQKYRKLYSNETYTFLGWYKVLFDANGNEIGPDSMPYNFSDPVTENMTIRAYWRLDGGYRILFTPSYTMDDGTEINAKLDSWTDLEMSVSTYADGAPTNVYYQPTGITANNSEELGEDYMFRGWQLVSVRVVDGKEVYTPLENNVFYDPGDAFRVSAGYADSNAIIHFLAVYEKKAEAYRRPDVADLTLDANSGFITMDGENPLTNSRIESWDGKGEYILDGENKKIVFGYEEDPVVNHFQTGRPVHLYKYATTLTKNSAGEDIEAGVNYFAHESKYMLLGFDDEPDENDFVATYPADSILSVQRKDDRTIYAVWEPRVYLNIVNATKDPDAGSPGGPLTISLSSTEGTTLYVVNEKTGTYDRTPVEDLTAITVEEGETLRLAIPYGKDKPINISGTNELGTGILLYWQGELNGVTEGHPAGEAKNHEPFDLSDTLVEDNTGITVTFRALKSDYTLVLDEHWENGNLSEVYFSNKNTDLNYVGNGYTLPSPSTRLGYEFIGWAETEEHADNEIADYPSSNMSIDNVKTQIFDRLDSLDGEEDQIVTLYAVWKAKAEASTVYVYKEVPQPGSPTKEFEFHLYSRAGFRTNGSNTDSYKEYSYNDYKLTDGQYLKVVTVFNAGVANGPATMTTTVEKYQVHDDGQPDELIFTYPQLQSSWTNNSRGVGTNSSFYMSVEEVDYTAAPNYYDTDLEIASVTPGNPVNKTSVRKIEWDNSFAGGTVIFTNTRRTVDVTVKKELEGPNITGVFTFGVSYLADGETVERDDIRVTSNHAAGTILEKIPVGAQLTLTEKGNDLLNYITTARMGETALTVTKPESTTAGGVTTHYRAVTANITASSEITFKNVLKSLKVKIVKIGSDGINEFKDVEAQFTMTGSSSNVFSARYSRPVTTSQPRGNVIFETGESYGGGAPDPVLYVGEYTLEETRVYGNYIKLDEAVGITIEGTEDNAVLTADSEYAEVNKVGEVWVVTVKNLKTINIKVQAALADPMIEQFTFRYSGSYKLNGVLIPIEPFDVVAYSTVDGSVSPAAEPKILTVPLAAVDLTIEEDVNRKASGDNTVGDTYDIWSQYNEETPVTGSTYTYPSALVQENLNDTITFINKKKTVDIDLTKIVDRKDTTGTFGFTVKLGNGDRPIGNYTVAEGLTTGSNGTVSFRLSHEETKRLTVPVGAKVTVTEVDAKEATDPFNEIPMQKFATAAEGKRAGVTYDGGTYNETTRVYLISSAPGKEGGTLALTYTNSDSTVPVRFLKIDGYAAGLGGAQFKLYTSYASAQAENSADAVTIYDLDDNEIAYASSAAAASGDVKKGEVVFKITPGVYWMKETKNPDSATFLDNVNIYRVEVIDEDHNVIRVSDGTDDQPAPDVNTFGVLNIYILKGKTILKKVSEAGAPLEGAVFEIYRADLTKMDWTTANLDASDKNGIFFVGELPFGTYYLKEITAPTGYAAPANKYYKVVVQTTGEITAERLPVSVPET